jgi:hypothetical protein
MMISIILMRTNSEENFAVATAPGDESDLAENSDQRTE